MLARPECLGTVLLTVEVSPSIEKETSMCRQGLTTRDPVSSVDRAFTYTLTLRSNSGLLCMQLFQNEFLQ